MAHDHFKRSSGPPTQGSHRRASAFWEEPRGLSAPASAHASRTRPATRCGSLPGRPLGAWAAGSGPGDPGTSRERVEGTDEPPGPRRRATAPIRSRAENRAVGARRSDQHGLEQSSVGSAPCRDDARRSARANGSANRRRPARGARHDDVSSARALGQGLRACAHGAPTRLADGSRADADRTRRGIWRGTPRGVG